MRNVTKESVVTHAAPAFVRYSNPLTRGLLRLGVPMGPNLLLTVRGRTTGLPRTAPVAVVETDGRRLIIAAYGEVHWVRNLRAAGEADTEVRGRTEHVAAVELSRADAVRFYGETMPAFIGRLPLIGRFFGRLLFGLIGPEVLNDPARAAQLHPVFELLTLPSTEGH
jgi:deazaflavin-dependent oxidoreductase (nitroreductase family)